MDCYKDIWNMQRKNAKAFGHSWIFTADVFFTLELEINELLNDNIDDSCDSSFLVSVEVSVLFSRSLIVELLNSF